MLYFISSILSLLVIVLLYLVYITYKPDTYFEYYQNRYNFLLDNNIHNKLINKYKEYCLKLIKDENIHLFEFDTIYELNNLNENTITDEEKDRLAAGIYKYIPIDKLNGFGPEILLILQKTLPSINLTKDYNVFTLAHELGHHFCVKKNNDRSELAADNYILEIAKQCLTPKEIYCLRNSITAYSRIPNEQFDIEYDYESLFTYKEYKYNKKHNIPLI